MQILPNPELPTRDLEWYKSHYERLRDEAMERSSKEDYKTRVIEHQKVEIEALHVCIESMKVTIESLCRCEEYINKDEVGG